MSDAALVVNKDPEVRLPRGAAVTSWQGAAGNFVVVLAAASATAALQATWDHRAKVLGWLIRDDTRGNALLGLLRGKLPKRALLYRDVATRERVLHAWRIEAAEHLIAEAEVIGDELVVSVCDFSMLRIPLSDVPHGAGQPVVERYGAFLEWPDADVQWGLDDLRLQTDPDRRARAQQAALVADHRYGDAIRVVRRRHLLRQVDIAGVSAREIGRIERGERTPRLETLRKLAAAHGMEVNPYLEAVAEAVER